MLQRQHSNSISADADNRLSVANRLENKLRMAEQMLIEIRQDFNEWRQSSECKKTNTHGLLIDHGTFSISYKGRPCDLGNTMAFNLIARLNKSPGNYIHLDTLKQDVWNGKEISDEAVQRQISTLRQKLRAAGIKGIEFQSQRDCYRLMLR
jgi:DNA-binding response OmpR family regulator